VVEPTNNLANQTKDASVAGVEATTKSTSIFSFASFFSDSTGEAADPDSDVEIDLEEIPESNTNTFLFEPIKHLIDYFYGTTEESEATEGNTDEAGDDLKQKVDVLDPLDEPLLLETLDTLTSPKEPEMVKSIKNMTNTIISIIRKDYFENEFKVENYIAESPDEDYDDRIENDLWNTSDTSYLENWERQEEGTDTFLSILDSIQLAMEGGGIYNRRKYSRLQHCFARTPPLQRSQENLWRGFVHYYRHHGGRRDSWGGNPSLFSERNKTNLRYENLEIIEPCNVASNIAYYFMAQGVCEYRYWSLPRDTVISLVEASANLAAGSTFYHGSHTKLGQVMDNFMISVISYIIHQASLANIPGLPSAITDLTDKPRALSGVQISKRMVHIFLEEPVDRWLELIGAVSVPDYSTTFTATFCTVFTLVLPVSVVDAIVPSLTDAFQVHAHHQEFILVRYLPEIRQHFESVNLTVFQRLKLLLQILSATKKLVFAFLWQESFFEIPRLKTQTAITVGSFVQPYVNSVSSIISWLPVLSTPLANGEDVYPGEKWCKSTQPHSLWHLQSAAGLLDYILVADSVYRYTGQREKAPDPYPSTVKPFVNAN